MLLSPLLILIDENHALFLRLLYLSAIHVPENINNLRSFVLLGIICNELNEFKLF
jgi:hypothetical protein